MLGLEGNLDAHRVGVISCREVTIVRCVPVTAFVVCNTRTAVQKYERNTAFDWLTDSNQGMASGW